MDAESWFSVTPEATARHIAERMARGLGLNATGHRVGALWVDAFAGAGGSAIQLALHDPSGLVIAIDIDPCKVAMARHNATLYGVDSRIEFIVGDFLALAPRLRAHAVHLSPPWGGLAYARDSAFDLHSMRPCGGLQLFDIAARVAQSVAYYLPKSCDRSELEELSRRHASHRCELQELLRREGGSKWVHVLAAFCDHTPIHWLSQRPPGMHTREIEPHRLDG